MKGDRLFIILLSIMGIAVFAFFLFPLVDVPLQPGQQSSYPDAFSSAPGLHWTHMPVTYNLTDRPACGPLQARRIDWAMAQIQNETNRTVSFLAVNGPADMVINCVKGFPSEKAGYITQGESQITRAAGTKILEANITFYNMGPATYSAGCRNYPNVEIHEILHAFRFGHSNDSSNIMAPEQMSCRYDNFHIGGEILEDLKATYTSN